MTHFQQLEQRRLFAAGIDLFIDGPGTAPEGNYTLEVSTPGDAAANAGNATAVTVEWGDGFQTTGSGAGDYTHSLSDSGFNYEGNVPLTNYTITAQAVTSAVRGTAGRSFVSDAVVDAFGRRVTVGGNNAVDQWEVRRYLTSGDPDPSFGTGGLVTLDFGSGIDNARSVAIDGSGRIVVAGAAGSVDQFIVARFNDNGTRDATFSPGTQNAGEQFGDGVVYTAFGADAGASAVAIQPDGRIVVGGTTDFSTFALARYDTNGTLDTSFGTGGKRTDVFGGFTTLSDVALQTSGTSTVRIVAVGSVNGSSAVVAYTGGGALDTTFDGDGKRVGDVAAATTAVAIQGDGKVLVGGDGGNGELVLLKYTAGGALDTTFGQGGSVVAQYEPLGGAALFDATVATLVVQDDLSIVAGGTLTNPTIRNQPGGDPQGNRAGLAIFRFDSDGNVDTSFDKDGVLYTDGGTSSGGAVAGGHAALSGETIVQSGTVQDAVGASNDADAIGLYLERATFAVAITNAAPVAGFAPTDTVGDPENNIPPSNLPTATPGQFAFFALETTDPSLEDSSFLTYEIDWGDGTSETFTSGGTYDYPDGTLFDFPLYVAHAFEASGTLTITLRVSDDDGALAVATRNVTVATSSGVIDDPANPGHSVLYVVAPRSGQVSNSIVVKSTTASSEVRIDGANTVYGPAERIVVYGNVGDDDIKVNGVVAAKMEFYGGPGNDKLKGGERADVLVGGDGDDMLVGGAGRDFLVGGRQADKIVGDSDDDILIGAIYVDAGSRDAVSAVMAEWTSTRTYTQRVNNLRLGGGANGAVRLIGHDFAEVNGFQTVFDDGVVDKLTGDAGTDWFFANDESVMRDKITDLMGSEFSDSDREYVFSA